MGTTKLFLGNLEWKATEEDLRGLFDELGVVGCEEVKVVLDRDTGRSRGFAFATFGSEVAAEEARGKLDGADFAGRILHAEEAEERRKDDRGGGRGSGGGRGDDRGRRKRAGRRDDRREDW